MKNLYEELGLRHDCSAEEIKFQYRVYARKHHPDLGGDAEAFKRIKFAYEILSDPEKRKEYDTTGCVQNKISITVQANETLSEIVTVILLDFDPINQNFLELIQQEIKNREHKLHTWINERNFQIEKLELTKLKIHLKNNNVENLLDFFIDTQIKNKKDEVVFYKMRLEVLKEMIKILNNYSFGASGLLS